MSKMKKMLLLLPVMLMMLVTGCLKDDIETIVLLGSESEVVPIDSVPGLDTLLVFIADSSSMHDTIIELPRGNFPPDIQGEFVFKVTVTDTTLFANNNISEHPDSLCFRFGGKPDYWETIKDIKLLKKNGELQTISDTILEIKNYEVPVHDTTLKINRDTVVQIVNKFVYYPNGQHNGLVPCEIYGDVMEKDDKYNIKSVDGYVMGDGDAFAVYFIVEYDCEQSGTKYKLTRGYIVKGRINDKDEISEAWVACVNMDCSESSLSSLKNEIFVYKINDLVKASHWVHKVS